MTADAPGNQFARASKILSNYPTGFPRRSSHERVRPINNSQSLLPFPSPLPRASCRSHARGRFPPVASAFGGASEPVAHPERRAHIACVASTPSWVQNPRPFAHRRLDPRARARLRRTAPRWKIHPTRTNPVRPNRWRAVSRERPRSRARDARDEPLNVGRDASAGA